MGKSMAQRNIGERSDVSNLLKYAVKLKVKDKMKKSRINWQQC